MWQMIKENSFNKIISIFHNLNLLEKSKIDWLIVKDWLKWSYW